MEIRIRGSIEFIIACTNSDVLVTMINNNFIVRKWRPFTPLVGNNHISGVVKKTKKGIIIMSDLAGDERKHDDD